MEFAGDIYYDVADTTFDLLQVEVAGSNVLQATVAVDFIIKSSTMIDATKWVRSVIAVLDDEGVPVLVLKEETGSRSSDINTYFVSTNISLPPGTYNVRVHLEHQGLVGVQAYATSDPITISASTYDPFDGEIVKRIPLGRELTWAEGDENWTILDERTKALRRVPPIFEIGEGLPELPAADRAIRFETDDDKKAVRFFDLKKIFSAQGANTPVAERLSVASYANMVVLEGTGDVLLIDAELCAPGSDLHFSVLSAGLRFRHLFDKSTIPLPDRPANYDTLVPLHISTKADYTTINEKEPFTFKLVEYSTGREFHDWSRSAKAGSVEQTTFVATRAEGSGLQVGLGFSVWGFTNGETDTVQRIYGSASFQPNAAKNGLVCTGAGVLTGIKTTFDNISVLSIVAADLADGRAFCIGTSKRVYPVSGTATVGAVSDDSGWFEHSFGYTFVAGGALVINDASKGAQISL